MKVWRESGAHLHISYLQGYGRVNWPIMDEALEKADTFVSEGRERTWDRYPYSGRLQSFDGRIASMGPQ